MIHVLFVYNDNKKNITFGCPEVIILFRGTFLIAKKVIKVLYPDFDGLDCMAAI